MSVRDKAGILFNKLYSMWRKEFTLLTVDDLLELASEKELDFYYYEICVRR